MSGYGGGSFSKGGKSSSSQQSSTVFPGNFLSEFEQRYGRGLSLGQLFGLAPQTQSLFGGGQIGYGPTGGAAPYGSPGGAGGGGAQAGPQTYSLDQVQRLIQNEFGTSRPQLTNQISGDVARQIQSQGWDPNALTREQIGQLVPGRTGPYGEWIRNALPTQLGPAGGSQAAPGVGVLPGQPDIAQLGIPARIQALFGAQNDTQYDPYSGWRTVPSITAPTAAAQQMNVAPGGFDRYENALYRSLYDPQQRSLNEQGAIADRQLMAQLAQSGLSSSGTGIGQVQQARLDRARDLQNRASDAAFQATTQRFGAEFAQQQFNAKQRQETALANAGFDLRAQEQNAANVLAGDIAKADNYVKTLGLNTDRASRLRQDFLQLMGITQEELKRVDARQMEVLGMFLNSWLQQGALLGNLGQQSSGTSKSGGAWSFSQYGGGGAGGGGG